MSKKNIKMSENTLKVAEARYFMEGEDWEKCCVRVATNVASVEPTQSKEYTEKFLDMIYNMNFIPAGRVLRNAGRVRGSMLNCYHLPCNDSIEEIGQFLKDCLILWSEGGGVGVNLSKLRPEGDLILGKGGRSSGAVSFLIAADAVSKTIESGGQRRAAGLASMDISHPEIEKFIDAKLVDGTISSFNISVMINDAFLQAVEEDSDWELKFNQRTYRSVKARYLWDKIISNMVERAEPGILNTTNLFKNNSWYYDPVCGVNPCWTGDTRVSVADGRGDVSFKQLAEDGKDVNVYCFDFDENEVIIKTMYNPRMTSEKEKILKITLDDNTIHRCTENHNWYTDEGLKIEASMLKVGDKLHKMVKNYKFNDKSEIDFVMNNDGNNTSKFLDGCFNNLSTSEYYEVINIEYDGFEEVYNGTVDGIHNYYVFTQTNKIDSNEFNKNYILSANCGEAVLAAYDSCDLGSLVLPNFITGSVNTNWQKLEKAIKLAVRFLDNVLDVNKYVLRRIDEKAHMSRRIGLGIMGLADYLFAKELRYGSDKAILEIEKLIRFIRDVSYEASIELAVEKGSFPKFDPVLYSKSSFVRKLPGSLRLDIKEKGIRNVTLLSIPPTGTTSLLPEVTSGIEPLIFKSYKRSDRIGDRIYIHSKYKELLLTKNEIPDWFVDMKDLTPKDHFETQAVIQKYVDGAVSKTINMPAGTDKDELSRYLLVYTPTVKGATVYVDGSRGGQVYNSLTDAEAIAYLKSEGEYDETLQESDVQCTVCELNDHGEWSCDLNGGKE